jgi:hypothetical protein
LSQCLAYASVCVHGTSDEQLLPLNIRVAHLCRNTTRKVAAWDIASSILPCLGWLRTYQVKQWFLVSFDFASSSRRRAAMCTGHVLCVLLISAVS